VVANETVAQDVADDVESVERLRDALRAIRDARTSVIILSAASADAFTIMSVAQGAQMTGAGWTWVATDAAQLLDRDTFRDASRSTVLTQQAMQGMLAVRARGGHGAAFHRFKAEWSARDESAYPGRVHRSAADNDAELAVAPYVAETIDAAYAVVAAAERLVRDGVTSTLEMRRNGRLLDAMQRVAFDGVTGRVQFDANGDPKYPLYDLANFVGDTWRDVGVWDPRETKPSGKYRLTHQIVWPGASLTQPGHLQLGAGTAGALCAGAAAGGSSPDVGLMVATVIFALLFAGALGGIIFLLFKNRAGFRVQTA